MSRKNWPREIIVGEKFVPGGQVLAKLSDRLRVFVWGILPGEKAEIQLTKKKKSYAEAIATEIFQKNSHRIAPRDAHFLATSPWQIVDFDYELKIKDQLVRESFSQEKINLDEIAKEKIAPIATDGKDFFYRNKMEYSLYWNNEKNQIELAFHRRGSHQKIPIDKSSIERPEIFAAAKKMIAKLNENHEPARKYQSLLARANQNGEVSAALFENGKSHPRMRNLRDRILGREYSYSPNGFFQINLPVYEMALKEIARRLLPDLPVVDMYSGVGTIGLSVADDRELTLVETNEQVYQEMCENVKSLAIFRGENVQPENARATTQENSSEKFAVQSFPNIRPIHAKAEEALDFIVENAILIVDPPRAGLDEKVIARIREIRPRQVVYLSCNPTTQARDLAHLLQFYDLEFSRAYNFFPRTPHIENLVILKKKD